MGKNKVVGEISKLTIEPDNGKNTLFLQEMKLDHGEIHFSSKRHENLTADIGHRR